MSVVACATVIPSASVTGPPAGVRRLTLTPATPGVAPSAASSAPELSRSRQTRLPSVKGVKKPRSMVRFEWLSPCGPLPGPPPRSPVGSSAGPRLMTPVRMPFVAGSGLSRPLSVELMSALGFVSVTVEDLWNSSGWAVSKLALSTSTR